MSAPIGRFRRLTDWDKAVSSTLRKRSTAAEVVLWNLLRGNQVQGLHFRRQQKIGKFVVDFFCVKCRLAIEVDGGIHLNRVAEDQERTRWLETLSIRVIRFSNEAVFSNPQKVFAEIENVASQQLKILYETESNP